MPKIAAGATNKNVTIAPHGTGKVVVGTGAADATVQSDGDHNLILQTGNSTTGKIEIADGANGNIDITPNGTGEVDIAKVDIDGGAVDGITLGTNSAVTEAQIDNINIDGNEITSTDTNGNIDLTPNGTGEVNISKVDIDSGAIDGTTIATSDVTVGSGKTLDVSGGSLTTSTAQKQAIVDGADITTVGIVTSGTISTGAVIDDPTMTQGSDATGDVYYRAASGKLTRLATGADGTVLTSTGVGAVPAFEGVPTGGVNTPAFEASLSGNSAGTDDTFKILPCNTELFDVGGCYNNTGGTVTLNGISVPTYAWAPNEACKVIFYATAQGECGPGNLNEGQLVIKKDGTVIKQCRMVDNDGQSRNSITTYALVEMNGSSNYLQAFYKIDEDSGAGWTLETGVPAGSGTTIGGFKVIE